MPGKAKHPALGASGVLQSEVLAGLFAVVADGLDGAAFHGLGTLGYFFLGSGLLYDKGVTTFIAALKEGRSGFAAEVAVDALLVDIEFAGDVAGPLFSFVCHR